MTKTKTLLISEDEAAAELGISKRNLQNMRYKKKISFVRVGYRVLYSSAHLEQFIEDSTCHASAPLQNSLKSKTQETGTYSSTITGSLTKSAPGLTALSKLRKSSNDS